MIDLPHIGLAVAFLAGLVAFLSPCVLPLLPAYVGYFGGASASESPDARRGLRGRTFRHSLLFSLGFIIVFMILGAGASGLGRFFILKRALLTQLGGALFLLFGLFLLGLFKAPWLYREARFHAALKKSQGLNAFLIGLTFGFAWTPCIGPILGTILFLASQTGTVGAGTVLLFAFGLGIALPFLLVSLILDRVAGWLKRFSRATLAIQRVAGVLLLGVSFLMLTKHYGIVTSWILRVTNFRPSI